MVDALLFWKTATVCFPDFRHSTIHAFCETRRIVTTLEVGLHNGPDAWAIRRVMSMEKVKFFAGDY